jgi:hypothetical protein
MQPTVTILLTILLMSMTAYGKDNLFWTLAGGAQAATIYDLQTTLRVLQRCPSCGEANPIMKPFAGSTSAAFSAGLGFTAASIYGSHRLRQRGARWWWLPLAGQIGIHTVMGIRNNRLH